MPNHNFIDMTGKTYNWLYVKSRAENTDEGRTMWNCVCLLCGKECVIYGKYIRNGKTKSCGCYRSQLVHDKKFEDLTGQWFHYLFVEGYAGKNKYNNSLWNCRCICNNHIVATTAALKRGSTKSCGCWQREITSKRNMVDITGKQCGWLLPETRVGLSNDKGVLWKCKCLKCGGSAIASTHALLSGEVTSCGCIKSRSELIICDILEKYGIKYQRQKRFVGCKNTRPLMFDVYLPDYNIAIEYDGEFHYKKIPNLNNDLEYQRINDEIKDRYCNENDIILLRIPYWEKENIESILSDWLFLNDAEEANSSSVDLSA